MVFATAPESDREDYVTADRLTVVVLDIDGVLNGFENSRGGGKSWRRWRSADGRSGGDGRSSPGFERSSLARMSKVPG